MLPLPPTSFDSSHVPALRNSGDDKKSPPAYLYLKRSIYYFRYALPNLPGPRWAAGEEKRAACAAGLWFVALIFFKICFSLTSLQKKTGTEFLLSQFPILILKSFSN